MKTRCFTPITVTFALGLAASSAQTVVCAQAPDAARVQEISAWVAAGAYSPTPTIDNREFWGKVGRSSAYRDVIGRAESDARQEYGTLPDELYLEYSRNGNRSNYERVFFAKLRAFRTLVVAECVENKGRFTTPIQQVVASYAKDRSWVLPAHDGSLDNFEGRQITIDLFASEVACDLANAHYILGDRLDEASRKIIRDEVARRVFEPYTKMVTSGKPGMWWLTGTNNWNAVCLANVTGTALAMLESPAEKAFYVAAAEKYIRNFFRGFTDDGYCSEGIGYWNYGYGCFVRLGHMVHEVTDGHVDLFALPRARSAGMFARRMEITPGQYPAFADCSVGSQPSPAIMEYVTRHYDLPPTAAELRRRGSVRWLDEFGVFSFLFDRPPEKQLTVEASPRDWFEDAGILICRGTKTSRNLPVGAALKGGHNAEHHNHNDVGSYVVCIGDHMPLVDPGAEVYTRRTFSGQRYVSGVLNSFGHPVPRVAGELQKTGRSAAAKVLKLDFTDQRDTLQLDIASAYAVPALQRLSRTFIYQREPFSLTVQDEVAFDSAQEFGTALITFEPWEQVDPHHLRFGSGDSAVSVEIDSGGLGLSIESTIIDEDVRGGRQPTRIGIDLAEPAREAVIRLTIRPLTDVAEEK